MSRIDQLIAVLCPNGVEFKNLAGLCCIKTGKLDANAMVDGGKYPFYTCNATPYRIDTYSFDTEAILVSGNGSQIGHINYYNGKFDAYQRTYVLSEFDDSVNVFFLFYWCRAFLKEYILKNVKAGSVPYITLPILQKFVVAIPPLPVQEEIVRILDSFTELEAKLHAEFEARKTQYEFYKNTLLDRVETREKLSDCIEKISNIRWKDISENELFEYIDLSSVNRDFSFISNTSTIDKSTAPSRAQQIVHQDDVLFGTTRPTLKRYCLVDEKYDNQICSTGFCVLRANKNKVLPKWLYFVISSSRFQKYIEDNQEGAGYPSISDTKVKAFEMPLPTLEEQLSIVSLLDRFNALSNDITKGIPAEIEARRKQYEYYRNKLLTFKELEA